MVGDSELKNALKQQLIYEYVSRERENGNTSMERAGRRLYKQSLANSKSDLSSWPYSKERHRVSQLSSTTAPLPGWRGGAVDTAFCEAQFLPVVLEYLSTRQSAETVHLRRSALYDLALRFRNYCLPCIRNTPSWRELSRTPNCIQYQEGPNYLHRPGGCWNRDRLVYPDITYCCGVEASVTKATKDRSHVGFPDGNYVRPSSSSEH